MRTNRADFRRFLTDDNMAAVGALPDHIAVSGKDQSLFHVLKQSEVAGLMLLLDLADHLKQGGDAGEALCACILCKAAYISVHS